MPRNAQVESQLVSLSIEFFLDIVMMHEIDLMKWSLRNVNLLPHKMSEQIVRMRFE